MSDSKWGCVMVVLNEWGWVFFNPGFYFLCVEIHVGMCFFFLLRFLSKTASTATGFENQVLSKKSQSKLMVS